MQQTTYLATLTDEMPKQKINPFHFYGFYIFHGKTRTIDLPQLCYDSYISYYSTNQELTIAFKSIFRILLNTSDKTALRNAMNLHGIGSHSLRIIALSKTLSEMVHGLTPDRIRIELQGSNSFLCISL